MDFDTQLKDALKKASDQGVSSEGLKQLSQKLIADFQSQQKPETTAPVKDESGFAPISTEDYSTLEGQRVNALAPAKPFDTERGSLAGQGVDTLKIIPNILSSAFNIGKFLVYDTPKMVIHDIPVEAYNLVKEQGLLGSMKSLFGTDAIPKATMDTVWGMVPESAKQYAGKEEIQPIIKNFQDILDQNKGDYGKTFGQIASSMGDSKTYSDAVKYTAQKLDRTRIAFIDNPVAEILGYMGLKAVVKGVVNPAEGKAQVKTVTDSFKSAKDSVVDTAKKMKDEGVGTTLASPFVNVWDRVKTKYNEANKNHVLEIAKQNGTDAINIIKELDDVEAKLKSVPKFEEEYNSLLREKDRLLAERDRVADEVNIDVKAHTNIIKEDIKNNSYESPEIAGADVIKTAQDSKLATQSLYNQSFKTPDGQPIVVDATPIIKPLEQLMSKSSSAMERGVFESLRSYYSDFILRDLLQKHNGNKWLITAKDLAPYKKYLPEKIFKKAEGGEFDAILEKKGIDTTEVNYGAIDEAYYREPVVLDNLQQIRNSIHDSLGNHGGLLKDFDVTVKSAMNSLIENSVKKANPDAWDKVVQANKKWENISESEITSSALKEGIKSETVIKNIYKNWKEFTETYSPEQVDKFRHLKAQEILDSGITDGKVNKKYSDLLDENRNILGNKLYNEMKSIQDVQDVFKLFNEKTGKKVEAITKKAKEAKASKEIIGENLESSILKVKSIEELNKLAETANLKPFDLGDIAATRIMKKHGFTFDETGKISNAIDMKPSDFRAALSDWQKIGGNFAGEVQSKMFRPELKTAFEKLKKADEEFAKASGMKEKGVARRAIYAAMAALSFVTGHPFLGTGFTAEAVLSGKKPPERETGVRVD